MLPDLKKRILADLAILLLLGGVWFFHSAQEELLKPPLRTAAEGGRYLNRMIDRDGQFVYIYDPVGKEKSDSYNILRHAGTTYALLELYGATGDMSFLDTAEKALGYLERSIQPCPLFPEGVNCVEEGGDVNLGGNALTVLAFSEHAAVSGSREHIPLARSLARWMVGTQSPDGEFTIHKMDAATGAEAELISSYYPGEALFALMRLYEIDGDDTWLRAAEKGARWLIRVRDRDKRVTEIEHDHWLLYALEQLHEHRPDEEYLAHAERITSAIISSQSEDGGYGNPPRSTPTATRTEGLIAAYRLFDRAGREDKAKNILDAILRGIDFQLSTQMTGKKIRDLGADPLSRGGFHNSSDDYSIRIDYVQHNISALLGYMKISNLPYGGKLQEVGPEQ